MTSIAKWMRSEGWTLRSGHAKGADQAFGEGAGFNSEIFLPWASYNNEDALYGHIFSQPSEASYEVAAQFHPNWDRLSVSARTLLARNSHQILGSNLDDPVNLVICWTPNGSLTGKSRLAGGTGQALRIAHAHSIPIFNLARPDHLDNLKNQTRTEKGENK